MFGVSMAKHTCNVENSIHIGGARREECCHMVGCFVGWD